MTDKPIKMNYDDLKSELKEIILCHVKLAHLNIIRAEMNVETDIEGLISLLQEALDKAHELHMLNMGKKIAEDNPWKPILEEK